MFRYLAQGTRRYGDAPLSLRQRPTWEFEAVVKGRIAPILSGRPQVPVELTLWALPPQTGHGWTGVPGRSADVLVFHPLQVPPLLEQAARAAAEDGRHLSVPLTPKDVTWLREIHAVALEASNHPDHLASLRLERVILDLALFVLDRVPARWLPAPGRTNEALVVRVLAWLEEHLAEGVDIADACDACGCSPAHLRRIFHTARGMSPRQALSDLRLERADQHLADPDLRLDDVARLCGYADAPTLCRTYRARRGTTPRRMPRAGNPRPFRAC